MNVKLTERQLDKLDELVQQRIKKVQWLLDVYKETDDTAKEAKYMVEYDYLEELHNALQQAS